MARVIAVIRATLPYLNDLTFALGLTLVAVGLGIIYPPLSLIVIGVVFVALAILGARKK